ncbi:MAG: hypothetical protein ACW98D_17550, partial [Promethearchaeota archaeon]
YANGRIAIVAVSTFLYAISLVIGLLSILLGIVLSVPYFLLLTLSVFLIPTLYGYYYGRRFSLINKLKLIIIYFFYFFGRSLSIPVAMWRDLNYIKLKGSSNA